MTGFRLSSRPVFLACLVSALALFPAHAEKTNAHTGKASSPGTNAASGILPGSNSKDPINIDAAKLDYYDKEQKLVYTGNVIATQGEGKLQASTLTIFLTPKDPAATSGVPSSSSQVRRMEATGPVTLVSKDQIGTGDSGVYEKSENKVYLIGNVTLTQGPNVTKGDKLVYDLTSKQSQVTGHVRSMFLPNNSTDEAKDSKPAKPEGASKPEGTAKAP